MYSGSERGSGFNDCIRNPDYKWAFSRTIIVDVYLSLYRDAAPEMPVPGIAADPPGGALRLVDGWLRTLLPSPAKY
jgi:hypothetical protein